MLRALDSSTILHKKLKEIPTMSKLENAFILSICVLALVVMVSVHIGKPLVNTDYGNGQKVKSILLTDK